jgi:molybdopterin synthase catalytic subunit
MIRLQSEPIAIEALVASVGSPGDGAVAVFVGTVRDHNRGRRVLHLEYEAYAEMALSEMRRIVDEARARFRVSAVALVHRTGRVEVGQASVAVVVAAAHRDQALEACRFLIDTFKRTVPMWKREAFEGGEVWIEGPGETVVDPQR